MSVTRLSLLGGTPIARVRSDEDRKSYYFVYTTEIKDVSVREATDPVLALTLEEREGLRTDSGAKLKRSDFANLNDSLRADNEESPPKGLSKAVAWCREALADRSRTELSIHQGCLVPTPPVGDAARYYVSGPSGSGKSTYCSRLISEYRRINPEIPLYIFSRLSADAILDLHKPIRVVLDASFVGAEYDIKDYTGSIVVFDDIDTIQDKKLLKKVQSVRDDMLTVGRHGDITVITTSHQSMDWSRTRQSLLEASAITVFPSQSPAHQIKTLLHKYCGMSTEQIKKVNELPSRWITVSMRAPRLVMHEKGCFLLR